MQIEIANIIPAAELNEARSILATARFTDGKVTAGCAVRGVKNNQQANPDSALNALNAKLQARILSNPVFSLAVRPKRLLSLMFVKYAPGQSYGTHVDNAIMDGERTDVAFTLFLSPPETYDGGELILEHAGGEDAIKLPAACLFAYPATTLHRVAPVTRGERLVLVGWARSLIRDGSRRELLFDLDTARRRLFDASGKTADIDLLSKCTANLLRLWAED